MHSFYKKKGFKEEDFPNSTKAFGEIISLPLFPEITQEQIIYVVGTLNELLSVKMRP
jgi:dTDP-4-amino-4,6-dideoxygalactose transaminase